MSRPGRSIVLLGLVLLMTGSSLVAGPAHAAGACAAEDAAVSAARARYDVHAAKAVHAGHRLKRAKAVFRRDPTPAHRAEVRAAHRVLVQSIGRATHDVADYKAASAASAGCHGQSEAPAGPAASASTAGLPSVALVGTVAGLIGGGLPAVILRRE